MIEFAKHRLTWVQIYEELQGRIEEGVYQPRNPIPSLTHLVQEFGVARGTIRKVVGFLAEDGYLDPIGGKGTYVLPSDQWHRRDRLQGRN